MKISRIENVKNLKSVFAAENNRLVNGNWVSQGYSRKEKKMVKEYLLNQQYSVDLGLDLGNFGNTITACRNTDNSIVKVINVSYLKGVWKKSVSFVGHVESCHWNLKIGTGSILNMLDNHNTEISKTFVALFEEVYGEIISINIASIRIDKNVSPLLNAVKIEEFRYASQWAYYDYSNPELTWENAVEAFSHL